VKASDNSTNPNNSSVNVNVQKSGIFFKYPTANDYFINCSRPAISASFVEVDHTTVRMFLDGKDVTGNCTIDEQLGTITLGYGTDYLDDKKYEVVINGTSSLTHLPVSSNTSFVIDTTRPIVTIPKIVDSDDDGFPEAGERLYVHYTAIDDNLKEVWFGGKCNTSASGIIEVVVPAGNLEMAAYAVDLAGNVNTSAPVHIYNNNLVYFDDPSLGSFAGLDLTKTALYDVFSTAKVFTLTGPNAQMTAPTLGRLDKTLIPGSNVTIDCRKDDPIPAGTLPSSIGIYTTPSGTLDFAVKVPNVTNATLMIARANSTLIDQLIQFPSKDALTPSMLKDLLDSKKIVLYGKEGYAIVNVDDLTFESKGTISVTPENMPKTIRSNYVDLNAGFNTKNTPYGLTPLPINKLGQGEYALLAVCMDNDRFAIVAGTTFTVTKEADLLSTSAATYTIGEPVVVNSAKSGEVLSAVVLNSKATYTGNVTLDFSTLGKETFKSAYLLADGNQTFVKPYGKANVWLTKGYGNASAKKNAASVSVPTHDLLPGEYRVYMFLEDNGNVTSYGETTITLTTTPTPTTQPTIAPSGGGGGRGGFAPVTGSSSLSIGSEGKLLRPYTIRSPSGIAKVDLPLGTYAVDADGNPLTKVSVDDLDAADVPGVPSGAAYTFAGYAVVCSPSGARFEPAIDLIFTFNADQWSEIMQMAEYDASSLVVKWYDEATGEWETVPTTVDPVSLTVTASVEHFTIFGLFVEPGAVTPVVTPTTPPVTPTTPTTTTPVTPPEEGFPWTYVVIAVVIILVIAAGIYYYTRKP